MSSHAYRGFEIRPVQYADKAGQGYGWYIQSYHSPTGIPWDSQHCEHAYTLAHAKEIIDQRIIDESAQRDREQVDWRTRGDMYVRGDITNRTYMRRVRRLAQDKARALDRAVQVDFRNVDSTGRGFRAPLEIVHP